MELEARYDMTRLRLKRASGPFKALMRWQDGFLAFWVKRTEYWGPKQ